MPSTLPPPPCATPDVAYVEAIDSPPLATGRYKRRAAFVAALCVTGAVVAAVLYGVADTRATVTPATSISLGDGRGASVCYDSNVKPDNMFNDFTKMKEKFTAVRTYQTSGTANHIDVAAQVGLKIHAGVWIRDDGLMKRDMQAVFDGTRNNPGAVLAIHVGNEDMFDHQGGHTKIIDVIRALKGKFDTAGVWRPPIGSVHTDGQWLTPEGRELAQYVDVIGVNLQPFFGDSPSSRSNPIEDVKARFAQMAANFPNKQIVITEMGWPTGGPPRDGHKPSAQMAQKFANDALTWVAAGGGGNSPALYQYQDKGNPNSVEGSFGLSGADGQWKFEFGAPLYRAAFANLQYNVMLSTVPNSDQLTLRWWDKWTIDNKFLWVQSGELFVSVTGNSCLEATQAWNGGALRTAPCNGAIPGQHWQYDNANKQLRHASFIGFCLDLGLNGRPYLWQCHAAWDSPYQYQRFEAWL
ncbi:Aste57867_9750 [Aphanomyces stellatus]|uniref:glucan endo-1,3-beta-D-glucosidase n=1 Tax=Aphanomyces stellatus TaxID=120398 RepID=A0A485KNP1_9STRA|nr:hypothetical protein As57867_009711 [Aphanomyces stellatus]VFT86629.1 Aste57867_9750 [Aphanomyces stellatus]